MKDILVIDLLRILEGGSVVAIQKNNEVYTFIREDVFINTKLCARNVISFRYSTVYNCILIEC